MIQLNEANIDYTDLKVQKEVMLDYLQIMIAREDWHGVADAAMDLRDMSIEEKHQKTSFSIPSTKLKPSDFSNIVAQGKKS